MNSEQKIMYVRDPVLGNIRLSPIQEDLLKTVEVQRLSYIHQLGMTYHCYPGAHGMRLLHALGVSHLAGRIGRLLLGDNELKIIAILEAAGMLHDIGHTPWSHTLEPLYIEINGEDHMDLMAKMITGKKSIDIKGAGRIPEILASHGVNPKDVADLVCSQYNGPEFIQQMIFGEVDADMLDYLQRDFHFTGVAFGHIEVDRILSTMKISGEKLVFLHKGIDAVKDFLLARLQMYSSVYLHRKTRIVDQMMLRIARRSILELGEIDDFHFWTDDQLLSYFVFDSKDPWVREMAWRIKFRQNLFTQVFHVSAARQSESDKRFLNFLTSQSSHPDRIASTLEQKIARDSGIDPGLILVDLPVEAVKISEERFEKTGIMFLSSDNQLTSIQELDPAFSDYITRAKPNRSLMTVSCSPEHTKEVSRVCDNIFHRAAMPLFSEE